MKSKDIRKSFLSYFKYTYHEILESSSLIPSNDPTLLFTNAGMNQFKDVITGKKKPICNRVATIQHCMRAGGKHNDLEDIGYSNFHHTFFEMLGSFSFGGYSYWAAISYVWEFLTECLEIPKEKLFITIHKDDKKAEEAWLYRTDLDEEHLCKLDDKDNFWSMGDTGPCGYCCEFYYDMGGSSSFTFDPDDDRFLEIWNIVFMEYDRKEDGILEELEKSSLDTGAGLERLAVVMQGVKSTYETDIFKPLLDATTKLFHDVDVDVNNPSLRIIMDHIRASIFLIADGVEPYKEGRGYVLRHLIRRASTHGHKLGMEVPFLYKLVSPFLDSIEDDHKYLNEKKSHIIDVLKEEEVKFKKTLGKGMDRLVNELLVTNKVSGETIFHLHDCLGFPVELTKDFAKPHENLLDLEGYNKCMDKKKEIAKERNNARQRI